MSTGEVTVYPLAGSKVFFTVPNCRAHGRFFVLGGECVDEVRHALKLRGLSFMETDQISAQRARREWRSGHSATTASAMIYNALLKKPREQFRRVNEKWPEYRH